MIFFRMEHCTVKYEVREIEPSKWVWIILPADGTPVISPTRFPARERAVAGCIEEINNGIERTRAQTPKA
jgi:hypothetical protein